MAQPIKASRDCPDCGAALDFAGAEGVGDLLDCPGCGATFEVVSLEPLTLAPFLDEEK